MKRSILFAAFAAATLTAQANPTVEKNGMLVNTEGKTLYIFTKDAPGKSNCNARCADLWPPYFVTTQEGEAGGYFSVITRDDGRRQWAFEGRPLYFNATDSRPGDRKGGGADGVWSVVRSPAAAQVATPVGTPSMGTRYEGS